MSSPSVAPPEASRRPALSATTIPLLPRRQELFIRAFAVLSFAYAVYWVFWRWHNSLNWDSPVFSLILVIAETFGLLSTAFFIFTVWRLVHREPPPAPDGLSVDVFVTCYDEPLQLLRRTAIGARAIRYPHTTWFLDDGKRDEVKAMCDALGVGYIRREGNEHAKAGNLNHAFSVTRADFVLQLDADHVPLPNILDRLLGYFTDAKVAFVQSPQEFYNMDSFTHVVNDEGRRVWEENRLFFSLIQPGKDRINASFFCGSCGILRRAALDEIGGFSVQTITEDMETSMLLHARGWTSCYHGETLAYGLAPASATQYHVQRLRWGQGSMQILRKMNPLFVKGLDWRQKIAYFSSVIVYLDGVQRLVFYLAPVMFFLFGTLPIRVANDELMVRLVPYMFLTIASFELLSRGTGYILISERFNMTRFWTYVMATYGFFTTKKLKFKVTPKGAGEVPFETYAPQFFLATLSILSVAWALVARHYGWINYHDGGGVSTAFVVNGIWVAWNLYFAVAVVRHSISSRQQRGDYRFVQRLPTRVERLADGASVGEAITATTEDINSEGLSFRCMAEIERGTRVRMPLTLSSGRIVAEGIVTHESTVSTSYGVVRRYGVVFDDMPLDTRDAIELHNAHYAIPASRHHYRQSIDVVQNAVERFVNPRAGLRQDVGLPALVAVEGENGEQDLGIGLLQERSTSGVRLVLESPLTPGSAIRWDVPGTTLSGRGTVVFSRAQPAVMGESYIVGVQMIAEPTLRFAMLKRWRRDSEGTLTQS